MPDARTDVHNKRNYMFLNDNFFKSRALRKEGTPVSRDGPQGRPGRAANGVHASGRP